MANMLLIAAVKTAGSKRGRKVLGAIVGMVLFFFVFFFTTILSVFSVFFTGKDIEIEDIKNSKAYQTVRSYYDSYTKAEKERAINLEKKYKKKHWTYRYVEVYNQKTQKTEKKMEWYCAAEIEIQDYEYIPMAYTLAYLSCVNYKKYLILRHVTITEKELKKFWDEVGGKVEVEIDESDKQNPEYLIYNEPLSIEDIADLYFETEDEKQKYYQVVHAISSYTGDDGFEETEGDIPEALATESFMSIPLYKQYANDWGAKSYGTGTISKNGCGPTCIAMVLSYLKGTTIRPDDVVDYVGDRYYIPGAGSSWEIFAACADYWDVDCMQINTAPSTVAQSLRKGCPVILSMGPGMFTSSGHFIILTGITSDGKVTVNDPNDNPQKNFAEKTFSLKQILREAKGGWSFDS